MAENRTNLDKRISVFEKYKEMVFLALIGVIWSYFFVGSFNKLDKIDDRLYRIEMNTNTLTLKVNLHEESIKELQKEQKHALEEINSLKSSILILQQRRD
ncbi:MAG: hypothetical protein GX667_05110 [Xanthomonadaceae bacterium]|nr:hypothetical protein [Xanthomonadaceae bacterium]